MNFRREIRPEGRPARPGTGDYECHKSESVRTGKYSIIWWFHDNSLLSPCLTPRLFVRTISFSDNPERETIGPRAITLRGQNWSTLFWMWSAKSPRAAIVSRVKPKLAPKINSMITFTLLPRLPTYPLSGRRHRIWYGNSLDLQNQGGVSRQDYEHFQCHSFAKGTTALWVANVVFQKCLF